MRRIYFLSIVMAGLLSISSCSKDDSIQIANTDDENAEEVITDVVVKADAFELQTRTSVGTDLVFAWDANDKLGVFPEKEEGDPCPSSQVSFVTTQGGTGTATFNGSGWGLVANRKYYAYYPYSASAADTLVKFTLSSSATQIKNDTTTHLGANDIMYSSATPQAGNTAHFQFHHLGSIMKFEITVPGDATDRKFTKVELSCANPVFPQVVSFVPAADNLDYKTVKSISNLTLTLGANGSGFVPVDGKLSVWFMVGATDLSGNTLSLTVYDQYDKYTGSVQGANQRSGKAHRYTATVSKAPHADSDYYVDMGLPSGKKWATSNLTIKGIAFSGHVLGDFYAWGELQPYYTSSSITVNNTNATLNAAWRDGYSAGYVDENHNKNHALDEYTSNTDILKKADDAAFSTLGGNWRMPTRADMEELCANSTITASKLNGIDGVLVTSKINGNKLFIPYNGYVTVAKVYGYASSKCARLWLADCYSENNAYVQEFNSNTLKINIGNRSKSAGNPIRPVYVPSE